MPLSAIAYSSKVNGGAQEVGVGINVRSRTTNVEGASTSFQLVRHHKPHQDEKINSRDAGEIGWRCTMANPTQVPIRFSKQVELTRDAGKVRDRELTP